MRKISGFVLIALLCMQTAVLAKIGGGDITFKLEKAANVTYSHDTHVTKAGLKCADCHFRLFNTKETHSKVSMAEMQKGLSCGACHNGQRTFDVKANCAKCHKE